MYLEVETSHSFGWNLLQLGIILWALSIQYPTFVHGFLDCLTRDEDWKKGFMLIDGIVARAYVLEGHGELGIEEGHVGLDCF